MNTALALESDSSFDAVDKIDDLSVVWRIQVTPLRLQQGDSRRSTPAHDFFNVIEELQNTLPLELIRDAVASYAKKVVRCEISILHKRVRFRQTTYG